ncbi:MAG: hypothetical protein ACFFCS_21935 [Candidatus Hodarchaeota archaeon]
MTGHDSPSPSTCQERQDPRCYQGQEPGVELGGGCHRHRNVARGALMLNNSTSILSLSSTRGVIPFFFFSLSKKKLLLDGAVTKTHQHVNSTVVFKQVKYLERIQRVMPLEPGLILDSVTDGDTGEGYLQGLCVSHVNGRLVFWEKRDKFAGGKFHPVDRFRVPLEYLERPFSLQECNDLREQVAFLKKRVRFLSGCILEINDIQEIPVLHPYLPRFIEQVKAMHDDPLWKSPIHELLKRKSKNREGNKPEGDHCFGCDENLEGKPIHYVACTVLEGANGTNTWCLDLCQACSENLAKELNARW